MTKFIKDNEVKRASSGQDPWFGASAAEFLEAATIDKNLPAEQIMKFKCWTRYMAWSVSCRICEDRNDRQDSAAGADHKVHGE